VLLTVQLPNYKRRARYPHGWSARRALAQVKQPAQSPIIGWVTSLLSRAPLCFGRHVKAVVSAIFADVSMYLSAAWLWRVLLIDGPCIRCCKDATIGITRYMIFFYFFPCFGRHVKPLVSATFTVVCTNSSFKEG
jgi:hypothetical protein